MTLINKSIKELEAVALLRSLGYTVILPVKEKYSPSDKQLQDYFYKNMIIVAGSSFSMVSSKELHNDLKDLQEAQLKAFKKYNIAKDQFNRDIKFLLEKMFLNYNQLGIENLTRMGWLFTDSGSWILRKVATRYATDYYEMVISTLLEN